MRYAQLLDVPLALATNGTEIVEHDFDIGIETERPDFPSPNEVISRYAAWRGLDPTGVDLMLRPFTRALRGSSGAVKRAALLPAGRDRARPSRRFSPGDKRVLLTLATGTGKTFVSLQLIWKLTAGQWPAASRKPRILYLVDRNILVDQPISREFRPVFGDAIWKIQGDIKTGREIYFALYQALADTGDSLGIFRDYPADFFDLIIVDECHRGSARDD